MVQYHDKMSANIKDTNVAIAVIHIMDEKGGEIAKSEDEPFEELTAKDGENTQNDGGMSALNETAGATKCEEMQETVESNKS